MAAGDARADAASEDRAFILTRVFNAPRDLVWKTWSEAEHLAHWWGPKGFTLHVITFDFRPGGMFHYRARSAHDQDLWGTFIYREIVAPERIVYINSFSDAEGNTVRAPFSPTWPLEILNTLTLAADAGKTTLTLRAVPYHATEEERATFDAWHTSLRHGFTGTLDRLADYLAKEKST